MAEFLIKAVDAVLPDPTLDALKSYKRGHPIVVLADGWAWGVSECLPKFYIVKVPGVDIVSVKQYIAPWLDTSNNRVAPRLWKFMLDTMPQDALTAFTTTGQYTTTWAALAPFITNLNDGTTAE